MTQLATPAAVVAPFAGERLQFAGQTYQLDRDGDRYIVSIPTIEPALHTPSRESGIAPSQREVVMTTGSHHIQVYWIGDRATNTLLEFPFYYHIADGRWMLRDDTMLHPPGQPQFPSVWNDRCIKCHSVNGVPGLDADSQSFSTRVGELGIACEACHGPGQEHVAVSRHAAKQPAADPTDPLILNPRHLESRAATQICGRCHSATTPHDQLQYLSAGIGYRPGDDLHAFVQLNAFEAARERPTVDAQPAVFVEDYATDGYWQDGTCRVGGDEYNALIESPCYQQGPLSCLSCHSMHGGTRSDQLSERALDNRACTQCHTEPRFDAELSRHTHHADGSAGSSCYNCHMPHTSYALLTAMRSHRIDSPSVENSVRFKKPNACNLCHLDRTLSWTSDHLQAWYQQQRPALSTDEQTVAASVLWLLQGNAALRMIAAWHLGWEPAVAASGDDWQGAYLGILMNDSYAAIRCVSFKTLQQLPGFDTIDYAYDAPLHARRRSVIRLREAAVKRQPAVTPQPLLLDPAGGLRTDAVERLLRERDNRPVSIAE